MEVYLVEWNRLFVSQSGVGRVAMPARAIFSTADKAQLFCDKLKAAANMIGDAQDHFYWQPYKLDSILGELGGP